MAEPTLPPGTRVGEYVVGERLGVGGFSEVFRATHSVIDKTVALKVLHRKYCDDQSALNRFVDEARAMASLTHPGIADVFAFGELDDGRQFYAMELLPGRTLQALLAERTRLPLDEALPILRGIASAVDAAHAAGIAHRDLKPDNVFVLPDGSTKLIDFGIAKLIRDTSRIATETGSVLGTPQYMSPEQCRGRASDTRSDAYSFGALAYHVLVGEPPFAGEALEIALHHLNDRPVAPSKRQSSIPAHCDRVVLALLEKDPQLRPMPLATAVGALDGAPLPRRLSKRSKVAIIAAPLAIGVVALSLANRSGSSPAEAEAPVAETEGCKYGYQRLAGVWDAGVRARLGNRFAATPKLQTYWGDVGVAVDELAASWSVSWDTACKHDDRAHDPLLYAQRLTCLENVLLDLRAGVEVLSAVDAGTLADGFDPEGIDGLRGRKLVDCQAIKVLRSQVPSPPPAERDRIAGLLRDGAREWIAAQLAFSRRDTPALDAALDRHAAIARQVEKIDPPSAASLVADRAALLGLYALEVDQRRRVAAREALNAGIARIERSGDNVAIAAVYLALGALENVVGDGSAVTKLGDLLPRIELAVERAGEPILARLWLAQLRGEVAMRRGKFGDAIAPLRDAADLAKMHGRGRESADAHRMLFHAQIENGDVRDAVIGAEAWVGMEKRRYRRDHWRATAALHTQAMVFDAVGMLDDSIATRAELAVVMTHLGTHQPIWGRAYSVQIEHAAGRVPADSVDALRALAGKGTTPPLHNPDGPATARRAGMFELYAFGVDEGLASADAAADHAAILAFQRGDRAAMARHARSVAERCKLITCNDWIRFSRWLAVLASPANVEADLAALERDYGGDKSAIAYSGIVLAELGRWKDARPRLEAARGAPHIWESQADLAELDTYLGIARLEAGDFAGSRALLEEALAVMSMWGNGFTGLSYTTPAAEHALAKQLWNGEDADRRRALRLGARAVANYKRVGKARDPDNAAGRWLEMHTE